MCSSCHRVRDLLLISAQVWEVPRIAATAHCLGPLGSLLFKCPQAASFLLVVQALYTLDSHVCSVERGALEELESSSCDMSQTASSTRIGACLRSVHLDMQPWENHLASPCLDSSTFKIQVIIPTLLFVLCLSFFSLQPAIPTGYC